MTSLTDPSDETRVRSELDTLAQQWPELLLAAQKEVVRTEHRNRSAYAVLPRWFESSNMVPGDLVDSLPSSGGVRYGLDSQGRVQTAEHFEGSRLTVEIAASYQPDRHLWLRKTRQWGTFVELVRWVDGRPAEWLQTGRNTLRFCRGVYDEPGRLVEILNQSITGPSKSKVAETRDRLEYAATGTLLRITRSGIGDDRAIYQAKNIGAKTREPAPQQAVPQIEAADIVAPILDGFLKKHADRKALAVVLAYDNEATRPSEPLLGVIWNDDFERRRKKGLGLQELLNPAEYDTFDIPALSLHQTKIPSLILPDRSQQQFYLDLSRALAPRLATLSGSQHGRVFVYATDLECTQLEANLAALGIKDIIS
jgi:hypothetical protein